MHLATSVRGVSADMDISKASVHEVHFLSDIRYSKLNNCTLIGDRRYLCKQHHLDLFSSFTIKIKTPKRSNQKEELNFEPVFKKSRKQIEKLFSQLCDQFLLKRKLL